MTDDTELPKEIKAKLRELVAKLEIAENERDAYQCRSGKLEAELAAMRFPPQSMNSSILDRINAVREARAAAYEEASKVADAYRESCYTDAVNSLGEDLAKQIRQLSDADPEELFDAGPWLDRAGRLHEASGQRDSFSFREFL